MGLAHPGSRKLRFGEQIAMFLLPRFPFDNVPWNNLFDFSQKSNKFPGLKMPLNTLEWRFYEIAVYFLFRRISPRNFANKKAMGTIINDYVYRERECEHEFMNHGPFWHLFTPGEFQELIFKTADDYKFGITSSALALHEVNQSGGHVKLYAFAVMSNHIHELLAGTKEDCLEYFKIRKSKLMRYFAGKVDFSGFQCQLKEIKDLKAFRNEVAYINRNGFVNNLRETPFSYEWSSGMYYFNPVTLKVPLTKAEYLKFREKRQVFKSRGTEDISPFSIDKDYVSPLCFCEISSGESLFRSAHQYFQHLSRASESYGIIAKTLGDKIFLNDEEMFSVVYRKAKELYGIESIKLLPSEGRLKMARMMHFDYNASNNQIQRILKIDRQTVDALFPKPI